MVIRGFNNLISIIKSPFESPLDVGDNVSPIVEAKNKFDTYNSISKMTSLVKNAIEKKPTLIKKSIFYTISDNRIYAIWICTTIALLILGIGLTICFHSRFPFFLSYLMMLAASIYFDTILSNAPIERRKEYLKTKYNLPSEKELDDAIFGPNKGLIQKELSRRVDNPHKQNVLMLMPTSDYNGAFLGEFKDEISPFLGTHNIDIFFPKSIDEINYFLKTKKYHNLIFCGHGTKDSVLFNNNFTLRTKDINHVDFSKLEENAIINFRSCSTGQLHGIAQKTAEVARREVIAPSKSPNKLLEQI